MAWQSHVPLYKSLCQYAAQYQRKYMQAWLMLGGQVLCSIIGGGGGGEGGKGRVPSVANGI